MKSLAAALPELLFWSIFGLALVSSWRAAWIRRRARPGWREGLALSFATLLLLVALLEIGARLAGAPVARGRALTGCPLDERLGWICKAVDGHPGTRRPRALVIGDSFTAGGGLGQADRYYSALVSELGMEVWVRAGSGWGTLQELLALDGVIEQVRPDLVVLQVCANDFLNNSWELESASIVNNNLSRRPYWEGGAVVWRYPGGWLGPAQFLAARSALAAKVVMRAHRLRIALANAGRLPSAEADIGALRERHAPWRRAVATTEELTAAFARRVGRARLVALPVDEFEPYGQAWRDILAREGIPFVTSHLARLRQARDRGEVVLQADGAHWNARGHRYVGQELVAWLRGVPR